MMSLPIENGIEERFGRCYELCAKLVVFNAPYSDAVLVHGTIQRDPNPRIDHAWVEFDEDQVLDPVLGFTMPKDAYMRWANAEERVRYTKKETQTLILEHEHWGPWDK